MKPKQQEKKCELCKLLISGLEYYMNKKRCNKCKKRQDPIVKMVGNYESEQQEKKYYWKNGEKHLVEQQEKKCNCSGENKKPDKNDRWCDPECNCGCHQKQQQNKKTLIHTCLCGKCEQQNKDFHYTQDEFYKKENKDLNDYIYYFGLAVRKQKTLESIDHSYEDIDNAERKVKKANQELKDHIQSLLIKEREKKDIVITKDKKYTYFKLTNMVYEDWLKHTEKQARQRIVDKAIIYINGQWFKGDLTPQKVQKIICDYLNSLKEE